MKPLKKHTGIVAPMDRANVDTDLIIPKQFLKKIERTGFGKHLFHDMRYKNEEETVENEDFVLNRQPYRNATILLARENFGCGSSREHAPWALEDFGFRVIIAPSFADIFYNNCFKNGILPVKLDSVLVEKLFQHVQSTAGVELTVDLQAQKITSNGGVDYSFEIDGFRKEVLLNGWDDIGLTLRHEDEINRFKESYWKRFPYYRIEKGA